jgi:hypothetical protein
MDILLMPENFGMTGKQLLWSRSKIIGTFYWCLGGAFGFAGSLQSYGFAPHRQPQNFSPIPSV